MALTRASLIRSHLRSCAQMQDSSLRAPGMGGGGGGAPPVSQAQAALDNNTALQSVLKQRRMVQDALRQAMTITAASKGGNKGTPGAVCKAWGAGSQGQLGQPVINGQLRSVNAPT
jgi:hypothetical protein